MAEGNGTAPLAKTVGAQIRRIRRRMGDKTQTDAAVEVFGSEQMQSQWSKWETGRVMPQIAQLDKIARWGGFTLAYFGVDTPQASRAADVEEARALLREGMALFERAMELLDGADRK